MSQQMRVPDWLLERYLLGELPRRERRRLEGELQRDPKLRAALEELKRSDRQILNQYPPDQAIPRILGRAGLSRPEPAPRRRRLAWVAAPALALALLLLVILPPLLRSRLERGAAAGDYIGHKGGAGPAAAPALHVFRQGDGGDAALADGGSASPGDLLQLAYDAGGRRHGVILSIDGAGAVTLHFPAAENGGTGLRRGRRIFLPQAYELDRAPRFERFFLVTADAPLPVAEVLDSARSLAAGGGAMTAPLDLPAGWGQLSLLLRK